LTEALYKREQWQRDLTPISMLGAVHDGIYYGWSGDGKSIAINFDEGRSALTTLSFDASGVFSDLENDDLYYVADGSIYGFQQDQDQRRTGTWQSKEATTQLDDRFSVARLVCDVYPATLRVYRDGTKVADMTVNTSSGFRLPSIGRGRYWAIAVDVDGDCDNVVLSQSMREVR